MPTPAVVPVSVRRERPPLSLPMPLSTTVVAAGPPPDDADAERLRQQFMEPHSSSSSSANTSPRLGPLSSPVLPTLATVAERLERHPSPLLLGAPPDSPFFSDTPALPAKVVRFVEPERAAKARPPRGPDATHLAASFAISAGLAICALVQLRERVPAPLGLCLQQALVTSAASLGPVYLVSVRPAARRQALAVQNLGMVLGPLAASAAGVLPKGAPLAETTPAMLALTLAAQTTRRLVRPGARFSMAPTLRCALRVTVPAQVGGALLFIVGATQQRIARDNGGEMAEPPHWRAVGALLVTATLVGMLVDGVCGAGRRAHQSNPRQCAFVFSAAMIGVAARQSYDAAQRIGISPLA